MALCRQDMRHYADKIYDTVVQDIGYYEDKIYGIVQTRYETLCGQDMRHYEDKIYDIVRTRYMALCGQDIGYCQWDICITTTTSRSSNA